MRAHGLPVLLVLVGCQKTIFDTGPDPEGDSDTDSDTDGDTDGDTDADGDTDTGSDTGLGPQDPPVITAADGYCYEHTTGDTFFLWEATCQATDPQGDDTLAAFDLVNNRLVVLQGGTEIAGYTLTCDNTGKCFGSFRETDDGISCAQATTYTLRFTIADETGLVSAPFEIQGRQR
jgi:hypothetical protein